MAKCKICGTRLENNAAKCPACGAVVGNEQNTTRNNVADSSIEKSICPACGKPILGEHRFCPYCGENLKEPEVVDGQGENERQSFTQQSGQEQEEKNTHDFSDSEESEKTMKDERGKPQEVHKEDDISVIRILLCFIVLAIITILGGFVGSGFDGDIGTFCGGIIGMFIGAWIGLRISGV